MMRIACVALLLLIVNGSGSAYEEKDFSCPHSGDDETSIPSTAVCNGTMDCAAGADESDHQIYDESPDICAPQPYLETEVLLESRGVTSTSAHLSWSKITRHIPDHKLKLAGYILSGKSVPHSFQNSISSRLTSYQVQWLKPWTDYKIILRPFYTESGKPETTYKLGRAASAVFRTLPSEPEMPALVSVLSPQQRNVVLNIVGPSAWNSQPVGFHVRWEAIGERQGPRGEQEIELPKEWSLEENVLNTTLPLQGGMSYQLYVSAVGATYSGATFRGPEVEVSASVPLDSYDVSANAIDSSKAVVSWRASEIVDYFTVTVFNDEENRRLIDRRVLRGKEEVTSRYNVVITKLEPWTSYAVYLKGCFATFETNCSDTVNATFVTLPKNLPAPEVIWVQAMDTTSFVIDWYLPQPDRRAYDDFRVRYCPKNAEPCFVVYTKRSNLRVDGLQPGTTVAVDVRAQFRGTDGRPLLGPPVTASITTWSNVPHARVWNEANIEDAIGTSLLSWECTNSSVEYLQYRKNSEEWKTCYDSAECDATWNYAPKPQLTSGDLRLTHQVLQNNFNLWIRCCNAYGCGQESSVRINSHISGPPSLSEVTVFPRQRSALLRYVPEGPSSYEGLEVTWHCNGEKKVTYHNTFPQNYYYDSRKEKTIEGLPTDAEECEFFVSLYRDVGEKRYYSLPVQAIPA